MSRVDIITASTWNIGCATFMERTTSTLRDFSSPRPQSHSSDIHQTCDEENVCIIKQCASYWDYKHAMLGNVSVLCTVERATFKGTTLSRWRNHSHAVKMIKYLLRYSLLTVVCLLLCSMQHILKTRTFTWSLMGSSLSITTTLSHTYLPQPHRKSGKTIFNFFRQSKVREFANQKRKGLAIPCLW